MSLQTGRRWRLRDGLCRSRFGRRERWDGWGARVCLRFGAPGCAESDENASAYQGSRAGEEGDVDPMYEGGSCVCDEVMCTESMADCLGGAKRAAGLAGEIRGERGCVVLDAGAVGGVEDAAEDGDPECASELARDVVDRRRDALLIARQGGDDRGGCG